MIPWSWYNEIDPQKAAWLRELIARGLIAPGDVDERSIEDVEPGDLRGYTQCHFFAGIGIWSYALRLAGWPDSRPVWTGSCPCQPFSAAGKGAAFNDPRHLWPAWGRLIEARRPVVVFGEQVSAIDGLAWFDLVHSDLVQAGYTCGAVDLCAAGFGAPHKRQRLYWVADAATERYVGRGSSEAQRWAGESERLCNAGGMADDSRNGCGKERTNTGGIGSRDGAQRWATGPDAGGIADGLGHSGGAGLEKRGSEPGDAGQECAAVERTGGTGFVGDANESGRQAWDPESIGTGARSDGFWADSDWVLTRPQRVGDRPGLRPVERGSFPLAHGAPVRVGRLRGYGDGIVAPQAAAFVRAYMDIE